MKLFHVLHHEIMGPNDRCRDDGMLFFTASSLKKAVAMIKQAHVARWSWWEIQTQQLDGLNWPEHLGYYGPRGGKLAEAPYEKCLAIFLEERKQGRI